ncbi:MAG TPA: hypothetical protein VJ499_03040, partial [Flavisolibacter sp.]|nr:hypothetical protein [Flavisolibacter sp.]
MKQTLFSILLVVTSIAILFPACRKEHSCETCEKGNKPPRACAGLDQTITFPINSVHLNGRCSTDPNNDIVGYLWTKISGPGLISIDNAREVETQIRDLAEGIYLFQLKVTDAVGLFSMDTVQVVVYPQGNVVNPPGNNSPVDIYVAGDLNGIATYWKNGQAVTLKSKSNNSGATSIAVAGSDIYVAGWDGDGFVQRSNIAKYWKNGEPVELTGPTGAGANSIAVSGSDVFVAGWEVKGYASIAEYWKNGQPIALTDGTKDAEATCIIVVAGNVYVSGHENGVAKYWKNGQAVALTDGTNQAYAYSIAVDGSDVYVAGSQWNGFAHVARYWKNGQPFTLTNGSAVQATANAITVTSSGVYVAGWEGDDVGR